MWLVNAETIRLERFIDERHAPNYAIVSHTWGPQNEEITFDDMKIWSASTPPEGSKLTGWEKLRNACVKALVEDYNYIWVDTCCIDKSSSAELQEAIGSMFSYYATSSICFAYLADVQNCGLNGEQGHEFRKARWFTRGWTLQELLAPESLIFFNAAWDRIAERSKIPGLIEEVTGISGYFLDGYSPGNRFWNRVSVSERMSWAAKRETTRREDMAYCLLGLFNVSMPLLYGEGDRAFLRLQEEILKSHDDVSLFYWGFQYFSGYDDFDFATACQNGRFSESDVSYAPIMAPHVKYFRNLTYLGSWTTPMDHFKAPSFAMGQRGLTAHLPLWADPSHECLVYGILSWDKTKNKAIALPLISARACSISPGRVVDDEYLRPIWCRPIFIPQSFAVKASYGEILIRRTSPWSEPFCHLPFGLGIRSPETITLKGAYPPSPVENFVPLCRSPQQRLKTFEIQVNGDSVGGHLTGFNIQEGRRMFIINVDTTTRIVPLLLVMDYHMEPYFRPRLRRRDAPRNYPGVFSKCTLDCYVFVLPSRHFSIAEMLDLKTGKGWDQLKELLHIPHEGHSYYCLDDLNDEFLEIHINPCSAMHTASSIVVSLVARTPVTSKGESQRSSNPERQPWRFLHHPGYLSHVWRGSWEDYFNTCPVREKESVRDIIKKDHAKKRVFNDLGLVQGPTILRTWFDFILQFVMHRS
ncbi:heterokaryon incompatibility protein-domain-containing protein [Aspergillus alliaceus]|uniref:heterokaryon incompatibility protein-domain-containing protein n=1 Tax=Petromyces alliaceus TaxID=209559 RepID=UPI0012A70E1F|nr:heterokaryon incompatibility protein-domain-containing protein [Aspergillus alliaceus]KAB8228052.1 heterokaryon incompatibility protein-domain-containing protein [Aspergillus alliaceus]